MAADPLRKKSPRDVGNSSGHAGAPTVRAPVAVGRAMGRSFVLPSIAVLHVALGGALASGCKDGGGSSTSTTVTSASRDLRASSSGSSASASASVAASCSASQHADPHIPPMDENMQMGGAIAPVALKPAPSASLGSLKGGGR